MRVPWADLILGVIGTVKSRDYKLWWSTVKHPSSSPLLTFTGKCAVNDRDEMDHGLGSCHRHWSYKQASLPSTCASYLHYPWGLWQGNSMKFNEFWTWHNYFRKSDCARDISITESYLPKAGGVLTLMPLWLYKDCLQAPSTPLGRFKRFRFPVGWLLSTHEPR